MPIDTKVLAFVRPQADGRVRVREVHTDTLGREWTFTYLAENEAAATAIMNGRDLIEDLRDAERAEVLDFALAGNDPETFTLTDLTVVGMRRHLLRYFVRTRATQGTAQGIADACQLAAWVAARPIAQIESTLSVTTVKATNIRDRGVNLRDVLCPAIASDNTTVGGIEDEG